VHIHVAEDATDGESARRRGYAGIVDRLDQLGVLVPGVILAHGVHLTANEVRLAAERGAWFVQNPRSNQNNGVGTATSLGVAECVALGTDGFPADMQAEAAALDNSTVAAQRLAFSAALGSHLFGELHHPSALPHPQLEAARQVAQAEAQRLWARLRSL
jgi:cytosine/adenosine deaminase-related metal-dependent hydrolase